MLAESNGSPYAGGDTPKLRTACENCRQSKVKCNLSGKSVCTRCLRHGLQCQYGFANRSGKPKGSKNRATLRKLGQLQEEKPAMRGFRGSRLVAPVADMEPLVGNSYGSHIPDPAIDNDVSLPLTNRHCFNQLRVGLLDIKPARLLGKSPKLRQHNDSRVIHLSRAVDDSREFSIHRTCGSMSRSPSRPWISTYARDADISVRGPG